MAIEGILRTGVEAQSSQTDAVKPLIFWESPHPLSIVRVNEFDATKVIQQIDRRTVVMRFNNVVSFTQDRDTAGCFGQHILKAQVPVSKILFFNTLLPQHPLKAEGEHLVIGGEYRVVVRYD